MAAKEEVFHNGHVGKEFDILECPRNSQIANPMGLYPCDISISKEDPTSLGGVDIVDAIENRRLPRSIRSDDGVNVSLIDSKADVVEGHHAAEADRKVSYF